MTLSSRLSFDTNAIVVSKAKSLKKLNKAFLTRSAHSFTRTSSEKIFKGKSIDQICSISLPNCPNCNEPRVNENAKFCSSCGYQLTDTSVFLEIIDKDIIALPITSHRAKTIKDSSSIETIRDILIDNEHKELRKVNRISPFWADRIHSMAEEFIS